MPVNRKRIVKAIINDLETFESNADQFVVTAESLVSSYRVERAVKVTEIDLAYYQSEPIELPVIYGEEFLYKAYVVTKQGRQSVVSEFTKTISKSITAPFEFNVSNRKTSLKVEALFDAGITDIERVEYVIKSTAQTLDINSVPTHVSYNNEPLVIPLEPGETIYLYGRRVDSFGNMSSWIGLSGNPFTSASTLNKSDVGLSNVDNSKFETNGDFKGNVKSTSGQELINTTDSTINPNVQNYKKVVFTPSFQVNNNDDIASLGYVNAPIPTFLLTASSQDSYQDKVAFSYVKQSGDSKIKLKYKATYDIEIWDTYDNQISGGLSHYTFKIKLYNENGTSYNSTEQGATQAECEVDISNNTNFPVGSIIFVSFQAKRSQTTVSNCLVYVGEAYVV